MLTYDIGPGQLIQTEKECQICDNVRSLSALFAAVSAAASSHLEKARHSIISMGITSQKCQPKYFKDKFSLSRQE